jgi:hypothetical protein
VNGVRPSRAKLSLRLPDNQRHLLPRHEWPVRHLFPHAPQLFGSNWRSVQTPEQRASDPGHPDVEPPQVLFTHCPVGQTIPQPPQLFGSVAASTQAPPPQLICGAAHEQTPLTHVAPPVHAIPQPPQFVDEVRTLTQASAQSASGAVQFVVQVPLSQTWGDVQALGHEPQCFGSLFVNTQTPPQSVWPAGHLHAPATHEKPALHVRPQPPQFAESLAVSTQAGPHADRPAGHVKTHVPALQTVPEPHDVPQAPQLSGSDDVLVQTPPHSASPGGHLQTPPRHVCALGQATPHAPQLALSDFKSRQAPAHGESPVPHADAQVALLQSAVSPVHATPHAPQFFGSLAGSTHAPPQGILPVGQTHEPLPQTWSFAQTVVQFPQ